MAIDIVVVAALVILLALEWRYRRMALRLAAIGAALAVLWFTDINYTVVRRAASAVPVAERTRVLRGDTLPEYYAGVEVALDKVRESRDATRPFRLLALGMLVWLGVTPALRRARDRDESTTARPEGAG
jgi:hypothetical protein